MGYCHVANCNGPTTRFGKYCNTHSIRNRRHGHPLQRGITKADLKPYLALYRNRIKRDPKNRSWAALDNTWLQLVEICREEMKAWEAGAIGFRHQRKAYEALIQIAEDATPRAVVETVIATYLLQEFEPQRFRSDDAFLFQLGRRVRALSERNVGMYWDHAEQRTKRVYRDPIPSVTKVMSAMLRDALGGAGISLARIERRKFNERLQAKADLHAALDSIH